MFPLLSRQMLSFDQYGVPHLSQFKIESAGNFSLDAASEDELVDGIGSS